MTLPSPGRLPLPLFALLAMTFAPAWADLTDSPRLKIVASNYPVAYFAERIAGAWATVSLPVPEGEDPAFWKPDARAIGAMQKADAIALNGADYEKWLSRVSLPRLKRVDTSASFEKRFIVVENAVTHSHGPGGEHSHAGTAFTTWLDFEQAGQQADALAQALIRKRPELKSRFEENLRALKTDLAELDARLKTMAAASSGQPLLASHPVYQYLARRYGLNLRNVHWEPDAMPEAKEWENLRAILAGHPARYMLWEAQPAPEIAQKLKSLGIESVAFEPCANRPETGDFMDTMRKNLERIAPALHR